MNKNPPPFTFNPHAKSDRIGRLPQTPQGQQAAGQQAQGTGAFVSPNERNSVTQLAELLPIRVATGRPLEGKWSGEKLTHARAIGSLFGGKHFKLQLGHMAPIGGPQDDTAAVFRLTFIISMPVPASVDFGDPKAQADALRTAEAMMHMLNLQRIP